MNKDEIQITIKNIEEFRGDITFDISDLSFEIWDIFDQCNFENMPNTELMALDKLISTKNQLLDKKFLLGLKQDPRKKAYEFMKKASLGKMDKRKPIKITQKGYILDGNATTQVLMLLSWEGKVPVQIVS